jgi:hypothetical protein
VAASKGMLLREGNALNPNIDPPEADETNPKFKYQMFKTASIFDHYFD